MYENVFLWRFQGALEEGLIRFYLAELTLALYECHSKHGHAHLDLCPENVVVDKFGHIKLIDFGTACPVDSKGDLNII